MSPGLDCFPQIEAMGVEVHGYDSFRLPVNWKGPPPRFYARRKSDIVVLMSFHSFVPVGHNRALLRSLSQVSSLCSEEF